MLAYRLQKSEENLTSNRFWKSLLEIDDQKDVVQDDYCGQLDLAYSYWWWTKAYFLSVAYVPILLSEFVP